MNAVEMFAIFREIKTPGFTYESFVVSPIMSDTPDSPDEVPGTRHWIEALVRLECDRRNAEARREERRYVNVDFATLELCMLAQMSERLRVEKTERRRSVLKSDLVIRRISGGASVYRDRDRAFMGCGRRLVVAGEVIYGYGTVANGWAAEVRPEPGQVAILIAPGDEYSFARWGVLDARAALDADILDDDEVSLVSESLTAEARQAYLNLFENLGDAIAFESQVLSIGSNLLPQCAQGVLLGEPPTASYWQWLAGQVSK